MMISLVGPERYLLAYLELSRYISHTFPDGVHLSYKVTPDKDPRLVISEYTA